MPATAQNSVTSRKDRSTPSRETRLAGVRTNTSGRYIATSNTNEETDDRSSLSIVLTSATAAPMANMIALGTDTASTPVNAATIRRPYMAGRAAFSE